MKKRLLSLLLALCLAVPFLPVSASAANTDAAVQTVRALGILRGDENGELMLSSNVTRAQFVTMMARASSYKDTVGTDGSGYSLFKDVKSSHWASEYIRLAVEEGWASGYTDGTFRPDQTITLEEACTMVLRLLGYDSSALAGSFPAAQLNKASALGLREQISVKQGGLMTRADCAQLFYNLLTAKTSGGQTYALTLGYTLTNGEVDFAAVVKENLSGPYIAEGGETLPFTPTTVYRDDTASSSASLNRYDVYYYNEGLGTVWIYTERVAGKLTAISPDSTAPTSVTVAGTAYTLGSASAAYQLSALNGSSTGDIVTLLLGMDGKVVGVITGDEVDMMYYGVVLSSEKVVSTEGNSTVETSVTVVCTDGATRSFTVSKDTSYTAGAIVSVNASSGGVSIRSLSSRSLSGKVNKDATKLGSYAFSDNVKILDTTTDGGAVAVTPERLALCTLSASSVRYYTLNEKGELEHLILNDVTGDTWSYALLTSAEEQSSGMSISASYTYLLDGREQTLRSSTAAYPVTAGGIGIRYNSDGSVRSMCQLASVRLTELGVQSVAAGSKTYALADGVQVYLRKGSAYYLTALSAVNAEDYALTGWYDTASGAAGGSIRVIVATER